MADLKRNSIELMKEIKGEEVEMQRYWTPHFLTVRIKKEAVGIMKKYQKIEKKNKELSFEQLEEMEDEMAEFVANRLYDKQFTVDELLDRSHAPNFLDEMRSQVYFVAAGLESESTRSFLANKR